MPAQKRAKKRAKKAPAAAAPRGTWIRAKAVRVRREGKRLVLDVKR